ncbi:putative DNA (cytosine-5-)-methyltransferase [Aerococcus christensenii]|uniref:Cytosine-specific methyltransferase n=1 Tax=Aerococcus christensenii TaxID=87541 RepID=A0A133XTT5_9LACT|nr:DNA (cytosine-5-)-methyltransferase [Aerococcus christensenii]KXB34336.1 putative DNA (cytosine-5-)-methyltransferase [Aerococcus christensenii]
MSKQIHIRLDDAVYEAISKYNDDANISMQDAVSTALMQFLTRETRDVQPEANFTFIDLFAGIGGMRLAYEQAGGHCVYSNEWNKYSQQTYFANFGEQPDGDITKVDEKSIPDHDVLVAGFPCQPFSIAGVSKKQSLGRATGFEDKTQGTLFFDICRIIKAKRPKAFMLENVKNLKSHDKGRTFKVITEALEELDYEVFHAVLDGQNFVPQHRERILIVGFDRKKYGKDIDFHFNITPVNPKPEIKAILEPKVDDKYTLTDKLWTYLQNYAAKHRAAGNGFGYGIADPNGVSRTLSARYYKDGSEILLEQNGKNPRRLTPRECARLQGFPDDFIIPVSDTQAYKQFGNSVVVPLMANVAQLVVDKMKELDVEKNKKHQDQRTALIYETGEINERKVALMS